MGLSGLRGYLRENWGAPFVIGFMVLLLVSAAYLSLGLPDFANDIAVYAFYLLAAGVGFQIASYIKYGEGKSKETPYTGPVVEQLPKESRHFTPRIALVLATLVILGSAAAVEFHPTPTSVPPCQPCEPLSAKLAFVNSIKEPDGSIVESFGVSVIGGVSPYVFIAEWSDRFVQQNGNGVFTRTLLSNQTIPLTASVMILSADGERLNLNVILLSP